MIGRVVLLILSIVATTLPCTAQPALETIRIGIPGKLVDFAPFFVGIKTGIYRSEGLEPQFIVMRSGIIIPALLSDELDFTTIYGSTIRSACRLPLSHRDLATSSFFLRAAGDPARAGLKARASPSRFRQLHRKSGARGAQAGGARSLRVYADAMAIPGALSVATLRGRRRAYCASLHVMRAKRHAHWSGCHLLGDRQSNGISTARKNEERP